jgi:Transglutaminase-like superfamily
MFRFVCSLSAICVLLCQCSVAQVQEDSQPKAAEATKPEAAAAQNAAPAGAAAQDSAKPAQTPAAPAEEVKTSQKWEFGISIRAVNGPCAGLLGTFPIPADWPEQQVKVVREEISAKVARHSYREIDGLKQMVFEAPQLATGDTATCFVTVEVTKQPQVAPAETASLMIPKDKDVPREVRKFLLPSPLVESTNSKVRAMAKELTAGKETAWEQVAGIAAGVREKIRFEQDGRNIMRGVTGALRDGKADKEDLTATFVAICRAAKVPARMVWAIDYGYAEFYLTDADGKGTWYPCVVHQDLEVGTVKDVRPILEKGDNFKVPEDRAPQRFIKEFLTGKGGGVKPSVEFRRQKLD